MELVKNIFFNTDKLIEGSKVKISYTGCSLWIWFSMGKSFRSTNAKNRFRIPSRNRITIC